MAEESTLIGLLDLVAIVRKRWPLVVGVPAATAAVVYFASPSPPPAVLASAVLATNGRPSPQAIDEAFAAANETGRVVTIQEDRTRVTATATAPSETEARMAIDSAMAPFKSASVVEGDQKDHRLATRGRLSAEVTLLRETLGYLTASPPTGTGEYNPATYSTSVMSLSGKIAEIEERIVTIDKMIDMPLAVSGKVNYTFTQIRSSSRAILSLVAGLAVGFFTLVWLVALEALRRKTESPLR